MNLNLTVDQVAVLRKTLEHVIANPAEWRQDVWAVETQCGTVFCFAGHAAVTVSGAQLIERDLIGRYTHVAIVNDDPERDTNYAYKHETISEYARQQLGLDPERARTLFAMDNSLRRLAELCYLYSDGDVDLLHALPEPTEQDAERERTQSDDIHRSFSHFANAARERGLSLEFMLERAYGPVEVTPLPLPSPTYTRQLRSPS